MKMCQPKRPCDDGDIEKRYSQCINGYRTVTYEWADIDHDGKFDCDTENENSVELPKAEEVPCKQCTEGM